MTPAESAYVEKAQALRTQWLAAATLNAGSNDLDDQSIAALVECPMSYINRLRAQPKGEAWVKLRVASALRAAVEDGPQLSRTEATTTLKLAGSLRQAEAIKHTIRAEDLKVIADWLGPELLEIVLAFEQDEAPNARIDHPFDPDQADADGARIFKAWLQTQPAYYFKDLRDLTLGLDARVHLPGTLFDEALTLVRSK